MMYANQFVAVVKCDGKILREHDDTVLLPFGSDYSILLKNLSAKQAKIGVEIDGKDALKGNQILIEPNNSTELLGFMKKNGIVKRAFRFIQKTDDVITHRGDNVDDGMIRITYAFVEPIVIYSTSDVYPINTTKWTYTCDSNIAGSVSYCSTQPNADEGVTARGAATSQKFDFISDYNLYGEEKIIVLRLKGSSEPISIKTKLTCPSCGKKSKSSAKFCSSCGTSLI